MLIFVISPTSLHSAECAWEIDHALKLGKRIVPVVPPAHARTTARLDVALRGTPFAKELGEMRWVYFREWMAGTRPAAAASAASESSSSSSSSSSGEYYGDDQKPDDGRDGRDQDFRDSLTLLLREIDGDLEHTRMHTLLLKAALNWERRDFDKSMLLSAGPNPWSLKELNAARKWLSASALGIRPKPTPLHTSFIDASQSQVTAMQRRQIMAVCTFFSVFE